MNAITAGEVSRQMTAGDFRVHITHHRAGTGLRRHDHEAASLQLVLGGGFEETIGSRTYDCEASSLIFKPAGAHHADRYTVAVDAVLIELPHAPHAALGEIVVRRDRRCVDVARRIVASSMASPLELESEIVRALSLVEPVPCARERRPAWLDDAVDLARGGASLSQIAAGVGRHRTHVARAFREAFGVSAGAFVRDERLQSAAHHLRFTKRALRDVAAEHGFFDQSHFTRAFRARFGVSPAEYRAGMNSARRFA
ncbi:MAG: helix-turn-helix transcriptional regulator [Acidobacteria bacterium]|nr:helix-turn-helix transcriptional regulator [Acidobacteriota bacterium]MBV9475652.1 helix-turn-helix transcriptional regulator [Acidobacteriota bacterium]